MATTVYCDDAGFTGDNLLDAAQPFFAYAAVAIEPKEAAALVAELRSAFNLSSAELKGRLLYGRSIAPELLGRLVDVLGNRVSVALNNKLFSLGGKFFEYVYDPSIKTNNRFFYDRRTHFYVATALWAYLSAGDAAAGQIAQRFENLMRRRAGDALVYLNDSTDLARLEAMEPIIRFANATRDVVLAEIDELADVSGRIKFVLDLSFSSAKSVLATLGERFGLLDVVMDESQPLEAFANFFSHFIGVNEIKYITVGGRTRPLNFCLKRTVQFASSKTDPGLQLADIVASFAAAAARDRDSERGGLMLQRLLPVLDPDTVWPNLADIDLREKTAILNMCLISELADRAERGQPLLLGIDRYYDTMSQRYDDDPPVLN